MTFSRDRSLQQLVNGMFTFVGFFSRDGHLLEANRFALTASADSPREVYGKHVSEIPAFSHSIESRAQIVDILKQAAAGQAVHAELSIQLAGGRLALIDAQFIPLLDAKGRVEKIGAVGVEVTAQREAADAVARIGRQLRMLSSCNQAVLRIDDEKELLEQICSIIVTAGGYRFAWVGLAESGTAHLVQPVAWAGVERT